MDHVASRHGIVRRGIDEPGIHSVATSSPLVLPHQERVTVELICPAVNLLREVMDEALDERGDPQDVVETRGHVADAHLDGSKVMMGCTSHQTSRMVLMKPVSTRLLRSQTYSDQLRISGGKPAVGRVSMNSAAPRVEDRCFAPARTGYWRKTPGASGRC